VGIYGYGALMPAIEREFDQRGRLTIPQDYIKTWGEKVVIHPNYCSAVIRPKKVSLEDAIKSVEILLDDMRHQLEIQKEIQKKKEEKK